MWAPQSFRLHSEYVSRSQNRIDIAAPWRLHPDAVSPPWRRHQAAVGAQVGKFRYTSSSESLNSSSRVTGFTGLPTSFATGLPTVVAFDWSTGNSSQGGVACSA